MTTTSNSADYTEPSDRVVDVDVELGAEPDHVCPAHRDCEHCAMTAHELYRQLADLARRARQAKADPLANAELLEQARVLRAQYPKLDPFDGRVP